jgi:DNA-binding transcriptional LysR family regulator
MILSLERLLRFVAVAEQLSFTKAAALLRIDQPWLSRQIMQLEDQLGFLLFDRSGSRIALTPEGTEFLESAQEVAQAVQRVRQKAEEMKRRTLSMLRIGTSYATYSVEGRERLLGRFAVVRPNVTLDYSAFQWSDEVLEKISSGDLDFGIVFGPVNDPNMEVCLLDVVEASLGIPKEDPLAEQPSVALSDVKHRHVAVGVKDKASARYERGYSWIDRVGAIPVVVPEGRRFIFDVAEKRRLFVLCYTPADKLPESFVRRSIQGSPLSFDLCLVRAKHTMSSVGERLWRLGQELAAERQAAEQHDDSKSSSPD